MLQQSSECSKFFSRGQCKALNAPIERQEAAVSAAEPPSSALCSGKQTFAFPLVLHGGGGAPQTATATDAALAAAQQLAAVSHQHCFEWKWWK